METLTMTGPSEWKKMSNFFSIIIGQKEDKEEKMKTPMFH